MKHIRSPFTTKRIFNGFLTGFLLVAFFFVFFAWNTGAEVNAKPFNQIEDSIVATLSDAAGAVGGEFTFSSTSSSVNARWDIGMPIMPYTLIYRQNMTIVLTESADTFTNGTSLFYDMPAYIQDNGLNGSMVYWSPGKIAGTDIYLEFHTEVITFRPTEGIEFVPASVMAEALHQAALANGLYDFVQSSEDAAQPQETLPPVQTEPPLESDAEVVVVPYGENTQDNPSATSSSDNDFNAAWQSQQARGIRSAALPILGGLIGLGVAWLSGVGSGQAIGSASGTFTRRAATPPAHIPVPPPVVPPLPPTPPPLSAEQLYVQELHRQGMVWSDSGGWQTPEQVQQSTQWQRNDQVAVAAEDAAWRNEYQAERAELAENAKGLKKEGEELDANLKLIDFNLKMRDVNRELLKQNHYVYNPNQGIPVWDTLTQGKNFAWDKAFGTKGLTCEGYVDAAKTRVKEIAAEIYGPEAQVMTTKFDEKSSIIPREGWFSPGAWKDWCDSFMTDNHVLIRVDLPNKTELAVDFHQHNTGKRPPVVRPLDDARKDWKGRLGDHEFIETITER